MLFTCYNPLVGLTYSREFRLSLNDKKQQQTPPSAFIEPRGKLRISPKPKHNNFHLQLRDRRMAIQRSNIAHSNNGGGTARDLSPISPRSAVTSSSSAQFNPRLILSQIISLQSFHYLVLGVIFQINHILFATSITVDRIFTTKYLDLWSASGWVDNSAILMSSLVG